MSGSRPGSGINFVEADDGDVVFTADNVDFTWLGSVHDGEEEEKKN